ncbi:MAG: hypothetical protein LC734_03685 [Acidobacteria bacterium]|nr:hypothetical protein [Acidobacteriota bacterium]
MTMIAVMGIMVVFAMALLVVAPTVQIEVQREKELEAIRRGEEVAEAIEQYINFNRGKAPESIDDLLEGLPQGTKKRMILRPSAAIDPLSVDGKWLLVKPELKSVAAFAKRIQTYTNGYLPPNSSPMLDRYSVRLVNLVNTGTEDEGPPSEDEEYATATDNSPFIGVVSQSKARSVLTYYGIENHSKWMFTPLFRGGSGRRFQGVGPGGPGIGNNFMNANLPNRIQLPQPPQPPTN